MHVEHLNHIEKKKYDATTDKDECPLSLPRSWQEVQNFSNISQEKQVKTRSTYLHYKRR
jgi:hypothetical protein